MTSQMNSTLITNREMFVELAKVAILRILQLPAIIARRAYRMLTRR